MQPISQRELFVFAGQSNMMGACVYPAKEQIIFKSSYEYLHKPKRFGECIGAFKAEAFPSGEFSYRNLARAYTDDADFTVKSSLANYVTNMQRVLLNKQNVLLEEEKVLELLK